MNCAYSTLYFGLHWSEQLRVAPVFELSEEQEVELTQHPRFNMHFAPTSASWLKGDERFFRDISANRLRRSVFTSVSEPVTALDEYVAHHNIDPSRSSGPRALATSCRRPFAPAAD